MTAEIIRCAAGFGIGLALGVGFQLYRITRRQR